MPDKSENQSITIDGVDYSHNDLSENAKMQIANIQFVDTKIQQLSNEWAVADTARIGYTNALKNEAVKINSTK